LPAPSGSTGNSSRNSQPIKRRGLYETAPLLLSAPLPASKNQQTGRAPTPGGVSHGMLREEPPLLSNKKISKFCGQNLLTRSANGYFTG
jgi:hypothetical protein